MTASPRRSLTDIQERSSAARLAAVQALYEMDMVGSPADPVLREFIEQRWRNAPFADSGDGFAEAGEAIEPEAELMSEIVHGATGRVAELDRLIERKMSDDRPFERLEPILRAILRAAAYELTERLQVPARVVINEYVDVAKAFFIGSEPALVNKTLDALARDSRAEEMES